MAVDLEKINIARKSQGLEPLTELPPKINGTSQKSAEDIAAEAKAIEDKKKADELAAAELEKNKNKPAAEVELADDKLVELLNKRGITIKSLEEIKPKEDVALTLEQREDKKLAYGLDKGLVNKKEYESFVTDYNDQTHTVLQQYIAEAQKEDESLTLEEITEEFNDKYGLSAEVGTRKYKRGQEELKMLADKILQAKHKKIYDLENAYATFETTSTTNRQREQKIKAEAPKYAADVNDILDNQLKTIKVKLSDTETFELAVPQEHLDRLKSTFLDTGYATKQIEKGWEKGNLTDIMETALGRQLMPLAMAKYAEKYHLDHAAGTKGIVPAGDKEKIVVTGKQLTENQKKVLKETGYKLPEPIAN